MAKRAEESFWAITCFKASFSLCVSKIAPLSLLYYSSASSGTSGPPLRTSWEWDVFCIIIWPSLKPCYFPWRKTMFLEVVGLGSKLGFRRAKLELLLSLRLADSISCFRRWLVLLAKVRLLPKWNATYESIVIVRGGPEGRDCCVIPAFSFIRFIKGHTNLFKHITYFTGSKRKQIIKYIWSSLGSINIIHNQQ